MSGISVNDPDYAERLYKAAYGGLLSWFQRMSLKNQPRPYAGEVEAALRTACTQRGGAKFVWQERLAELDHEKEKPILISVLIARLSDHHWWERFVARHVLFHRGGEAIGSLASRAVTDTGEVGEEARWLVKKYRSRHHQTFGQKSRAITLPDLSRSFSPAPAAAFCGAGHHLLRLSSLSAKPSDLGK